MDEDMEKLMGFHDQKKEKEPIDIDDLRKQVVENAKAVLKRKKGPNYVWGAKGPDNFDCSGFTRFVYRQSGLEISEASYQQAEDAKRDLKIEDLKPGDLVFFGKKGKRISHVAMYIGDGEIIDSGGTNEMKHTGNLCKKRHPCEGVRIKNLNYRPDFRGGISLESIAIKNKIPLKNKETEKNRDKKSYKRDFEPSENTLFNGKENKKEVQVTVTPRKNIAEIKAEMSAKMKETNNENTINKVDNNKKTKVNTR